MLCLCAYGFKQSPIPEKCTSPLTYVCLDVYKHLGTPRAAAFPNGTYVECLSFCPTKRKKKKKSNCFLVFFELCEFKQKKRNFHWMTILSVSLLLCE